MKFLPHELIQVNYKILWFYSIFFPWMNITETEVLTGFWLKNGLGPLGVNNIPITYPNGTNQIFLYR